MALASDHSPLGTIFLGSGQSDSSTFHKLQANSCCLKEGKTKQVLKKPTTTHKHVLDSTTLFKPWNVRVLISSGFNNKGRISCCKLKGQRTRV